MINSNVLNIENTGLKDISEFIIDQQSGMITGYKTKVGADTVFPFSKQSKVIYGKTKSTSGAYYSVTVPVDSDNTIIMQDFIAGAGLIPYLNDVTLSRTTLTDRGDGYGSTVVTPFACKKGDTIKFLQQWYGPSWYIIVFNADVIN